MGAPGLLLSLAAWSALTLRAEALHTLQQHEVANGDPYRMRMNNIQDMQYAADIVVGGQTIHSVFDTGSFELLVFPKDCTTCGVAKAFEPLNSSSFVQGKRRRSHAYGSGSCSALDAHDTIKIGPLTAVSQSFWEARHCRMPLLADAHFNAVIGIGPPGEPLHVAQDGLDHVDHFTRHAKKLGVPIPHRISRMKKDYEDDLKHSHHNPSLLENLGVRSFSICLERGKGSPGWLIWNDTKATDTKLFTTAKVVGRFTWGIEIGKLNFEGGSDSDKIELGCKKGCGAILDTGTSLIAVPREIYYKAYTAVNQAKSKCNDIKSFPDLVMELGGKQIRLPPETYIGELAGEVPKELRKFTHLSTLKDQRQCNFLLMDAGNETTQSGPLVILGMPFFREYYTSFDVGSGAGNKTVAVAKADSTCNPASTTDLALDFSGRSRYSIGRDGKGPRPLMRVDAARLSIPRALQF